MYFFKLTRFATAIVSCLQTLKSLMRMYLIDGPSCTHHFTAHTELRALKQQLIHLVARDAVEVHVSTA